MKMLKMKKVYSAIILATSVCLVAPEAMAAPFIQCPGDQFLSDGVTPGRDAIPETVPLLADGTPSVKCVHLSAGDGYMRQADGRELYVFGFGDLTGVPEGDAMSVGALNAMIPAPKIVLEQGQRFYLSLTNTSMVMRPDLFDPHTVHFHGFPNAATIFDGVPDSSVSINMGSTFTYFYNVVNPGTYIYHCHVEAAEHMQMGMMGNLYVKPAQNRLPTAAILGHTQGDQYVYNDGDRSTYYDVEFPLLITSMDGIFHDASENTQPLPFAEMFDDYTMFNGRGYPDSASTANVPAPAGSALSDPLRGGSAQVESSLISATVGQKVLLRIANVSITKFFSIKSLGFNMKVVGQGAAIRKGPTGLDTSYSTNTVTLGGGEITEVIVDTSTMAPGKYFIYSSNLNYLSNGTQDFGGLMTEFNVTL